MTPDPQSSSSLLAPLFSSPDMRAVLEDRPRIQRMLDFEAALVRAEAALGIVPSSHVNVIAEACRAELYDLAGLRDSSALAGNPAAPLVAALTAEVGKSSRKAAGYVHWGATSQDVIDTAAVLELRAVIDLLLADLDRGTKAFIALAGRNRRNMTMARTQLQQALPMPLGLKFAGYSAALGRSRERLRRLRKEALVLQFGGAAGTLAALDDKGIEVSERLAALLDLTMPDGPWHSHRDRLAELAAAFAILAGTCGKIARDISLLMQSEIGEVAEPKVPGRGSSSTLPHTRSPVGAAAALSAAMVAPNLANTILSAQIQEHERSVGGWQAEWATFPALALVVSGTLRAVVEIAEGLTVDIERMKSNLEASGGLVFSEAVSYALAEKLGRAEAHDLVAEIAREAEKQRRPFKELLAEHDKVKLQISLTELERLFRPNHYQGSAQNFIDRLVASSQGRTVRRSVSHMLEPKLPDAKPDQLSAVAAATSALIATAAAASAAKPAAGTTAQAAVAPSEPAAKAAEAPSLPRMKQAAVEEPGAKQAEAKAEIAPPASKADDTPTPKTGGMPTLPRIDDTFAPRPALKPALSEQTPAPSAVTPELPAAAATSPDNPSVPAPQTAAEEAAPMADAAPPPEPAADPVAASAPAAEMQQSSIQEAAPPIVEATPAPTPDIENQKTGDGTDDKPGALLDMFARVEAEASETEPPAERKRA